VNARSAGPVNAAAAPGSSSRVNDPINRSIPARSSSSSRPKEYTTFVRDTPAAPSHSLCANCRYRTTCPDLFRRVDVRMYTPLEDTTKFVAQQPEHQDSCH
jgi:hypothetical protein